MKSASVFALLTALLTPCMAFAAGEDEAKIKAAAVDKIKAWVSNGAVLDAVRAQNTKNASISQADIDALDKKWRAETKAAAKPMIDGVLANPLSAYLKKVKADGKGLYTEIFVMDDKGLNVGQSDVTSDYWQGDEAKWQKTFLVGPDAIHVGEITQDESSQMFQSQVSLPVVDPATHAPIGAVTVGINVEMVLH